MTHFNEGQLRELETIFGLKRDKETLAVRDGVVVRGELIWWRSKDGPKHVVADGSHWINMSGFPDMYQLKQPRFYVEYID